MIKLVAFDLDGTIGNTIPMCICALKESAKPYVTKGITNSDIIKTFGLNEEGMMQKIIGDNWKMALRDFYVIYEQMHTMCPYPFDGITELITELKLKSIIVTLITGKGIRSCAITLQQFSMEESFNEISFGSPAGNRKAEAMEKQLKDYALHPYEMVYVGDAVSDIEACRKVSIRCLSAAWNLSPIDTKRIESKNDRENIFYSVKQLRTFLLDNIRKD